MAIGKIKNRIGDLQRESTTDVAAVTEEDDDDDGTSL